MIQLGDGATPVTVQNEASTSGWDYFTLVRSDNQAQLYHQCVHTVSDGPLTSVIATLGTDALAATGAEFTLSNPDEVPDNNLDEVRINTLTTSTFTLLSSWRE